jgi:hypothetical protein
MQSFKCIRPDGTDSPEANNPYPMKQVPVVENDGHVIVAGMRRDPHSERQAGARRQVDAPFFGGARQSALAVGTGVNALLAMFLKLPDFIDEDDAT